MKKKALKIEIVYDIICPWCYIGHHRLQQAIQKANAKVDIQLIPYQLRPDLPEEGISIEEYWKSKGITDVDEIYKAVIDAGKEEGLGMYPKKFKTIPNTLKLHQVIAKAQEKGVGVQVLHQIQKAYFQEGKSITTMGAILDITVGFLSNQDVKDAWEDLVDYRNLVLQKEQQIKQQNIRSVPTFIVDEIHRVTGAVPTSTLVEMLHQLAPKDWNGVACNLEDKDC
ncbi:DsbA family oxidoreductase [Ochrovirga pacifica]|uniref:DsbA family oxidoreductase n=1 Tax=Ochrovirga pacifica TaxID=1042376 RepID=UPI000255878D|nr:DsbA family oxidoreductase [Ochrovirga pacifica]